MMPCRDQVKLSWKVIRWLYWPSGWPAWVNIVIWICTAAVLVSVATDNAWGWGAAIVICMAAGFATGRKKTG